VSGLSALKVPKGVLIVHEADDPLSGELVDLLILNGFEVLCVEQRKLRSGLQLTPLSQAGIAPNLDGMPLLDINQPGSADPDEAQACPMEWEGSKEGEGSREGDGRNEGEGSKEVKTAPRTSSGGPSAVGMTGTVADLRAL
ncbi:MAG: hypothetical protein SGPRY_008842, partial [Prymnesium sp.]